VSAEERMAGFPLHAQPSTEAFRINAEIRRKLDRSDDFRQGSSPL